MYKQSNKILKFFSYLIYFCRIFFSVIFKRYDLVYVHYASHNALPLILLRKLKKFNIYTNVHGSDVVPQTKTQRLMNKYTRNLLKISSKVVVPSKYFGSLITDRYGISRDKIFIYPSAGVKKDIFFPYPHEKMKEIYSQYTMVKEGVFYIGFVSRIENGKGWDTFLKALKKLKDEDKMEGMKAIIVGSGNQYDDFIKMIEEFNLKTDIILIQSLPQEQLADIYNITSIFCFPTEREGESLGLVSLEAMACSVPVICSDFAAPKDYIINEYNGFKIEVGNYNELAEKINNYSKLPFEKKEFIKKNAYYKGIEYYTENILLDLEKLFEN